MVISLAWRYFLSKKRHPFIGVISNISVLGVAVGVGALITVLAVMSGFEEDLVERIVGTYAHSVVESDRPFAPPADFEKRIRAVTPLIVTTAPYIDGQALLQTPASSRGAIIRAARLEDESRVSRIATYLQQGRYPAEGSSQILIGNVMARVMNVKVGGMIQLYSPAQKKPSEFTVSGIFHSGMYDYDANLAYLALSAGQEKFNMPGLISGIAVKYRSPQDALRWQRRLQAAVGYDRYVRSWRDMNATLFGALKLEKSVMFVILTLIVLVACFNIIGTLTLLVMDRTKDIGILKAIGASEGHVLRIFGCVGLFIGVSGTVLGIAIGAGLCFILQNFSIVPIPAEIYYFDKLPVNFRWDDAVIVAASALVISLLSALYPALAAAKLQTSKALRYE